METEGSVSKLEKGVGYFGEVIGEIKRWQFFALFFAGAGFGFTASYALVFSVRLPENDNPKYVNPFFSDFDVSKDKETIMKYEGREYVLEFDKERNNVTLMPYIPKIEYGGER